MIARLLLAFAVAVLFALALGHPVEPAEATAALATVDACQTGNAIASHQLGEHEPGRMPLQTWILGALVLWDAGDVDPRIGRWVSFAAILLSAVAGAAVYGRTRATTLAMILVTPAVWEFAVHAAPGALLAFLLLFAWSSYEAGRRSGAPTLQWALPPIQGAAASMLWSPAVLFVVLPLAIEAARLAPRRKVSWFRLGVGTILAVALIGLWQLADAGFAAEPRGWWSRMTGDLLGGDPVLAMRTWQSRLALIAGILMPPVLLAVAGGWPLRRLPSSGDGGAAPATGVVAGAVAAVACALLLPGVPPAIAIPAGVVALGFLGTRRLLQGPVERTRRLELGAFAALALWVAAGVVHHPRAGAYLDTTALENVDPDTPVVVDRELGPGKTWAIVSALGRRARRTAPPGQPAWYVAPATAGPGLRVEQDRVPEGWSLLARPLEAPVLPERTAAVFEANLAAALEAYRADPGDALAAIWVGRRIAYLGRYREAIDWYGDALISHPEDSRLWRHRGHRYLSLRRFERAIGDLERAVELERGKPDRVEPDGLPNAAGVPRSTTQGNIWYHLGLAYYLTGDLENTVRCYRRGVELSSNDDAWVSMAHWLHIGLRRTGRHAEAAELLEGLRDDMEILENDSYHDLVKLYAGEIDAEALQRRLDDGDGPSRAALRYGLARWYEDRGDEERALREYRRIVAEAPWAAFGTIAAEAELARRTRARWPLW